ncbi:MAG TPA: F0F1 ATP synthase subunit B [Caulobacteraceae bacterium]|jgi:F-type H+-transporting ATPase subunit b
MELLKEYEFWTGLALLVFVAVLLFLGVHKAAAKALDAKAAKIQAELDEAKKLREEAQGLLASLKAQREETERRAAEMLANAEAEAKRLEIEAAAKLEEQIKRRQELAERRISNAEAQAAAEVKAAAADLAAQLAEGVLAERIKGAKSDPLIDAAVGQLATKLK